ncbi:tail fiber assembly protein [Pseudomonas plecoglossicida]|uniref:tail fiber assembly protein n=1 Tax=Pseudomonas plecoglossicida TaxID=70775 RepID=UPI0020D177E3|nr:tail fiber assembly protein [Pseudomonas plecoglossicida]
MMIKLSPVRSDGQLSVARLGDMLTVNGIAFDFAQLPEGATLPAAAVSSDFILDSVERLDGQLVVSLRLPHAADAPEAARFPADIIDPPAGQVELPGQDMGLSIPSATGLIDWSQLITAETKAAAELAFQRSMAVGETERLRAAADQAIAPLQDAIDLDEATEAEVSLLVEWKRFRVALSRLPEQEGYPTTIDWPTPPA